MRQRFSQPNLPRGASGQRLSNTGRLATIGILISMCASFPRRLVHWRMQPAWRHQVSHPARHLGMAMAGASGEGRRLGRQRVRTAISAILIQEEKKKTRLRPGYPARYRLSNVYIRRSTSPSTNTISSCSPSQATISARLISSLTQQSLIYFQNKTNSLSKCRPLSSLSSASLPPPSLLFPLTTPPPSTFAHLSSTALPSAALQMFSVSLT